MLNVLDTTKLWNKFAKRAHSHFDYNTIMFVVDDVNNVFGFAAIKKNTDQLRNLSLFLLASVWTSTNVSANIYQVRTGRVE